MKFTIQEIFNYINSHDTIFSAVSNLSEEAILEANEEKEEEVNTDFLPERD